MLPAPGLIGIWRTRLKRGDSRTRSRAGLPAQVLTVMHIGCDVPPFTKRKEITAFVTSTIERCTTRIRSLLEQQLTEARERLAAADGARIERLAWRDDAIAAEMAAMLRARSAASGASQPLLFEEIALEKTATAGASHESWTTRAPVSVDADATAQRDAGTDVDASVNASDASTRIDSTLVMALLIR